ncbi:MAG: hypothetical protein QNK04_19820 [Myxococcota bacterium]|nr:hypothetical protein [Myxococcota bacterium]
MSGRARGVGAVALLVSLLGCALTYDVEQRESEISRREVAAKIDDLHVSLAPEGGASWMLQAHFHRTADYAVHKRVERQPRFGIQGGVTEGILSGRTPGAASGSVVHPVWLLPFAALFDVTTFFLSAPPVWLASLVSSRDGERTDIEAAGDWRPCDRAVLGETDNPYAYLAPRLDDAGRSHLTASQIRDGGLRGRMWIVDCGGERESISIPRPLWQEISSP